MYIFFVSEVLTYYLAYDALAALTDPFELNGIEDGTDIVNKILQWSDNFNRVVPSWYLRDLEYLDIYDAERKPTGCTILRAAPRKTDEYVLVAHILIRNSAGETAFGG